MLVPQTDFIEKQSLPQQHLLNLFELKPNCPKILLPYIQQFHEIALCCQYQEYFKYQNSQKLDLCSQRKSYLSCLKQYLQIFKAASSKYNRRIFGFLVNNQDRIVRNQNIEIRGFCFTTTNKMNEVLLFYKRLEHWLASINNGRNILRRRGIFLRYNIPQNIRLNIFSNIRLNMYDRINEDSEEMKVIKRFFNILKKILEKMKENQVRTYGTSLLKEVRIMKQKIRRFIKERKTQLRQTIHKIEQKSFKIDTQDLWKVLSWISQWNFNKFNPVHLLPDQTLPPEKIMHISFPNLTYLNLNNNKIQSVEFIKFINAPHLKKLQLKNNQVSSLKPFGCCRFNELQAVRLTGNNFESHQMKELERLGIGKGQNEQFSLSVYEDLYPNQMLIQFIPRLPRNKQNYIIVQRPRIYYPDQVDLRIIKKTKEYFSNLLQQILKNKMQWDVIND